MVCPLVGARAEVVSLKAEGQMQGGLTPQCRDHKASSGEEQKQRSRQGNLCLEADSSSGWYRPREGTRGRTGPAIHRRILQAEKPTVSPLSPTGQVEICISLPLLSPHHASGPLSIIHVINQYLKLCVLCILSPKQPGLSRELLWRDICPQSVPPMTLHSHDSLAPHSPP